MIVSAIALTYASWCNCSVDLADYLRWHQNRISSPQRRVELERKLKAAQVQLAAERRARHPYPPPLPPEVLERLDQAVRRLDREAERSE